MNLSLGQKLGIALVGAGGAGIGTAMALTYAPGRAGSRFDGALDRSDRTISYNRDNVQTNGPYNHTIWNTASRAAGTAALETGLVAGGISGAAMLALTKGRPAQFPHALAAAIGGLAVGGLVSMFTASREIDKDHIIDPGKWHTGGPDQPHRG